MLFRSGIIKPGIPVVIGERQAEVERVFMDKAAETTSELLFASDETTSFKTDLLGDYQKYNLQTAVVTVRQLHDFVISDAHISDGDRKSVV